MQAGLFQQTKRKVARTVTDALLSRHRENTPPMTFNFTFRQGTERDFRNLLGQQHDITERLFDAEDDAEREELVLDQKVAFDRTAAVRSYQVTREETHKFSIRERNNASGFGWGLVDGDNLDELEAKLEAALQAVRNAKQQNADKGIAVGADAEGETFVIPE